MIDNTSVAKSTPNCVSSRHHRSSLPWGIQTDGIDCRLGNSCKLAETLPCSATPALENHSSPFPSSSATAVTSLCCSRLLFTSNCWGAPKHSSKRTKIHGTKEKRTENDFCAIFWGMDDGLFLSTGKVAREFWFCCKCGLVWSENWICMKMRYFATAARRSR